MREAMAKIWGVEGFATGLKTRAVFQMNLMKVK